MKKKILSIILCTFIILISTITIGAEEDTYYYWAISKDMETLYLSPNEFNNNDDKYINFGDFNADESTTYVMPWTRYIRIDGVDYYPTKTIKNVVVEEGMKPKSITRWFWEFENIEAIDLTNLDTSELMYMQETFASCKNLSSINVSNFNTEKVIQYAACFFDIDKLETLDLSSFYINEDVDIIETSGFFIYDLPALKTLKLPKTIKYEFPSPDFLKWVDENGNVIDVVTSEDQGKTLSKVNSYDVVVNNVLITDKNYQDVLKDKTVSYNPNTNTLTLNNATINKLYNQKHDNDYALIYTMHSLNINLVGNNKLVIPKLTFEEDHEEDVYGIYFPSLEDGDYELNITGDNLTITGEEDVYIRGIDVYDSDCLATNSANITIELSGEHARALNFEGDFINNGNISINIEGDYAWGMVLEPDDFTNNGNVLIRTQYGALSIGELKGNSKYVIGSIDTNVEIKNFKDVEFITEYENPYRYEYVINNKRAKALLICNDEPTYTWNKDYSKCTASINIKFCNYKAAEEVKTTYEKTIDATCSTNEFGTYTAAFKSSLFNAQTKENVEVKGTRHTNTLKKIKGKEATVLETGYKDAYLCNECHKYYEDKDHKILIGDETAYETWKVTKNKGLIEKQKHIITNDSQKFTHDSSNNLTFISNGIYEYFTGVKVDGKYLSKDAYKVKSGSIIVELNSDYLNTLSIGTHTISIEMKNVKEATTGFEVVKKKTYTPPKTGIE